MTLREKIHQTFQSMISRKKYNADITYTYSESLLGFKQHPDVNAIMFFTDSLHKISSSFGNSRLFPFWRFTLYISSILSALTGDGLVNNAKTMTTCKILKILFYRSLGFSDILTLNSISSRIFVRPGASIVGSGFVQLYCQM